MSWRQVAGAGRLVCSWRALTGIQLDALGAWHVMLTVMRAALCCAALQDPEGRSRGAGIVEFDSPHDALHSISLLSNSLLDGRQIMVGRVVGRDGFCAALCCVHSL